MSAARFRTRVLVDISILVSTLLTVLAAEACAHIRSWLSRWSRVGPQVMTPEVRVADPCVGAW